MQKKHFDFDTGRQFSEGLCIYTWTESWFLKCFDVRRV